MFALASPLLFKRDLECLLRLLMRALSVAAFLVVMSRAFQPGNAASASWTKLTNLAPSGAGTMMLLTDGTVMVQQSTTQNWMHLTPDAQGSYVNGVWTKNPIAPMGTRRLYYASNLLPNGKVWILMETC